MKVKILIGVVSFVLLTSTAALTAQFCGWFGSWQTKPPRTTRQQADAEAAARHSRCEPRHWRYIMLQQQQP